MHTLESLEVRTVETNFYSSRMPVGTAFRRIVAITYGKPIWAHRLKNDGPVNEYSYDPDESVSQSIELPSIQVPKLVAFFSRYMALDGTRQHGEQYNCHRFAHWMVGDDAAQRYSCPVAPLSIVQNGQRLDTTHANPGLLNHGQHGVIGARPEDYNADVFYTPPRATHSVVGLGIQTADCLQVGGNDGHLGITTYKDALSNHAVPGAVTGLFTE